MLSVATRVRTLRVRDSAIASASVSPALLTRHQLEPEVFSSCVSLTTSPESAVRCGKLVGDVT